MKAFVRGVYLTYALLGQMQDEMNEWSSVGIPGRDHYCASYIRTIDCRTDVLVVRHDLDQLLHKNASWVGGRRGKPLSPTALGSRSNALYTRKCKPNPCRNVPNNIRTGSLFMDTWIRTFTVENAVLCARCGPLFRVYDCRRDRS